MERTLGNPRKSKVICPECGGENPELARFCSQCGDFLGESSAERKGPPPCPLPSRWKKRYRVIKKLDSKEMHAYKIYDLTFDRIAILKYFPGKVKIEDNFHAFTKIEHPNIMCIYDTAITKKGVYLVHEEFSGTVFKDYIDDCQGLSSKEILQIFYILCDAVAHLHQHGIVLGDLQCSDIFLDKHEHPKIFNIEQKLLVFPAKFLSPQDDLPALASILYKMQTAKNLIGKNKEDKAISLPDGFGQIAVKCLQKQYYSLEKLLEELQDIEKDWFECEENEKQKFRMLVKKAKFLGMQGQYDEALVILQTAQQESCRQTGHELEKMIDKNRLLDQIVQCLNKASRKIRKKKFTEAQAILEKVPVMCELWEIPINMREKFERLNNKVTEGEAKLKAMNQNLFFAFFLWTLVTMVICVSIIWLIVTGGKKKSSNVNSDIRNALQIENKRTKQQADFGKWFGKLRGGNPQTRENEKKKDIIANLKKTGKQGNHGQQGHKNSPKTENFPNQKKRKILGFEPLLGGTKKYPHYLHLQTGICMVLFSPKGRRAFLISKDPLRQKQWEKVMGASSKTKFPYIPLKNIKNKEIEDFCQKTNLEIATKEQLEYVSHSDLLFLNIKKIRFSKEMIIKNK